jgi:hypothetical protein
MNVHSLKKLFLLLSVLFLMLACALPGLPSPAASDPTAVRDTVQTIVVATAGAAQTQTAMVLPPPSDTPTVTLLPSLTPTETPTPTATFIFIIPTFTNTPTATSPATATQSGGNAGEGCELVDQSPANGTVYDSRERFNVEWTMRNTSDVTWDADSVDFFHSAGRDMHDTDILDLPNNVRPDREITFRVAMRAPGNDGTYTSTWTLGTQRETLCRVSVRIVVR